MNETSNNYNVWGITDEAFHPEELDTLFDRVLCYLNSKLTSASDDDEANTIGIQMMISCLSSLHKRHNEGMTALERHWMGQTEQLNANLTNVYLRLEQLRQKVLLIPGMRQSDLSLELAYANSLIQDEPSVTETEVSEASSLTARSTESSDSSLPCTMTTVDDALKGFNLEFQLHHSKLQQEMLQAFNDWSHELTDYHQFLACCDDAIGKREKNLKGRFRRSKYASNKSSVWSTSRTRAKQSPYDHNINCFCKPQVEDFTELVLDVRETTAGKVGYLHSLVEEEFRCLNSQVVSLKCRADRLEAWSKELVTKTLKPTRPRRLAQLASRVRNCFRRSVES